MIVFRLGSQIPIPGINLDVLNEIRQSQQVGGLENLLILFSTLTGGALANCAIFSLGIMPYISASIIFSLLTKVVPSLEALSKEGPGGYRKINEYTRYATVPILFDPILHDRQAVQAMGHGQRQCQFTIAIRRFLLK